MTNKKSTKEEVSQKKKLLSSCYKPVSHINPLIEEALLKLQLVANDKTGIRGLNTGFEELNILTSGWSNGELIIISGRPGMGKTVFVLSLIEKMAINYNIPIALYSLEQTNIQITNRLISICTGISGEKINCGKLESYEWEQLDLNIKNLYDAPIYIETPFRFSIQEFSENARKMVAENGIKVIFLDYIQLFTVNSQYSENRYNEINYISRELKNLARELNIPIIAVSQMNREIDKRQGAEGKRPVLTDLRDSGTLCDDADIVCFIHRPEYYKITEDERGNSLIGLAEIIVAKQRNGSTGDIRLKYRKEIPRFEEMDCNPINPTSFFNNFDLTDKDVPF